MDRRLAERPRVATNTKLELGTLKDTLDRVPYALTLSDISAQDHPLVYLNPAFCKMTGYGDDVVGQNCRFLQGEFENAEARAEIRIALSERRRTQVLLKNQRKNGDIFHNLLLLDHIAPFENLPNLVVGTQFDLGADDPDMLLEPMGNNVNRIMQTAKNAALQVRLERRRIASDSTMRLIHSWCLLNGFMPKTM